MGILGGLISFISSGPAIQNLDRIDMRVDYKDGGVLLPVVVSQHLDGSPETQAMIRAKLDTYLGFIDHGETEGAKYVRVQLGCVKRPDPKAIATIDSFKDEFAKRGAELLWKS